MRRRLRRYRYGDTYTQLFIEVCGGDDFERIDADDVARALSMKVSKARDLCDVDKSEDGCVDHAGFVRIASTNKKVLFCREANPTPERRQT